MGVGAPGFPRQIQAVVLWLPISAPHGLAYGAITLYVRGFPVHFGYHGLGPSSIGSLNPTSLCGFPQRFGLSSSPFGRPYSGNTYWFLFLPLLRCFRSGGSPPVLPSHLGFPDANRVLPCSRNSHSGIPGSTAACASPRHIAACRALRRRPSRAIHQAVSCHA